jgi:hypothetical protein
MQHRPRFLNYTTDRVRRHQRLKVAEESITPTRSDQTNAVAVAATSRTFDSDFAARVPAQYRRQWAARIRREARAVNLRFHQSLVSGASAMTSACGNRVARAQGGIAKRILRAKSNRVRWLNTGGCSARTRHPLKRINREPLLPAIRQHLLEYCLDRVRRNPKFNKSRHLRR